LDSINKLTVLGLGRVADIADRSVQVEFRLCSVDLSVGLSVGNDRYVGQEALLWQRDRATRLSVEIL